MTEPVRIARYLSMCGVASRRKSEELITAGDVTVNGEVELNLARRVTPGTDTVTYLGEPVEFSADHLTLMFNKPPRVVVSASDPKGRTTVYDLLPEEFADFRDRLRYAGRLDFLSEGLLIFSTDGQVVNRLTHPSKSVEKEYEVWARRRLTEDELKQFKKGMDIGDKRAVTGRIEPYGEDRNGRFFFYRVTIEEGRNRQVRRMFQAITCPIARLIRVRIGALKLRNLQRGSWEKLGQNQIDLACRSEK